MYKIVLPNIKDKRLIIAEKELREFIKEATGILLETVCESEALFSQDAEYIVLGKCLELQKRAKLKIDYRGLGINGYSLKTVGKTLFIVGGQQYGVLNGVYGYLRKVYGYEIYAIDEYKFTVKSDKILVPVLDETVLPEVPQVMAGEGIVRFNTEYGLRMGFEPWNEIWIYVDGSEYCHNLYRYVKPEIYNNPSIKETYHPDWFCKNGLCLSEPEVFDIVLDGVKKELIKNPDLSNISVTQMDHATWCGCDKCKADYDKYGTNAGNMVKFMNKISRAITPWLEENFPDRIVNFAFFAYQDVSRNPPVKINEVTGQWEPIEEEVICEDNLTVWLCLDNAVVQDSYYAASNKNLVDIAKGWQAVCKKTMLWTYETNYMDYLVPMNVFTGLQDQWRYFKEYNVQVLFPLGQYDNGNNIQFLALKTYLQSKLRWNVEADVNKLTDEFFANYFAEAAIPMREFYDNLMLHFKWQENVLRYKAFIYHLASPIYWPMAVLTGFMNSIDKGYKAIAHLKESNPKRYHKLSKRITQEAIFVKYLMIKLYPSHFIDERLKEFRYELKGDCTEVNVTKWKEGTHINRLYKDWYLPDWDK